QKTLKGNFSIYLCSTAVNLDSIRANTGKDVSDDPSIELVELHIPPSSELPPELHTTKNLPSNLLPALLQAFQTSSFSFSDILNSVNPDLLIYDFFQPWAPKLASSKDADNEFAFGNFELSTDIILMKSSRGVEGKYIDYLSNRCKKQILPTGPLIPDASHYDDEKLSEIMRWLSEKQEYSTIYISFGSEYFLSKDQIEVIAKGLALCNVNFLWVLRFPIGQKSTCIEE
ncbi:UNVERIFIED_CONTAM: UDP-glucosyltransferase 29, partial [Sesamum angustifolium]